MEAIKGVDLKKLVEECEIELKEEKEENFKEEWQYKQIWMRPY